MTKKHDETCMKRSKDYEKILASRKARRRPITVFDPEQDKSSAIRRPISDVELLLAISSFVQLCQVN